MKIIDIQTRRETSPALGAALGAVGTAQYVDINADFNESVSSAIQGLKLVTEALQKAAFYAQEPDDEKAALTFARQTHSLTSRVLLALGEY